MSGFRRHGRTQVKCEVRLEHQEIGEVFAEMLDVSDTGVFVKCKDLIGRISIGDALRVQSSSTESLCSSIPSQLTVVRLTDDGVGFAYE